MKEIFKDSFADQYKKLYYKQLINNCPSSARIEKQHLYMDPKKNLYWIRSIDLGFINQLNNIIKTDLKGLTNLRMLFANGN